MTLQNRLLFDLMVPAIGAAAWMGSREGRRSITDLVAGTARPRWSRQLATWAATTAWAELACLTLRRRGVPHHRTAGVLGRPAVVAGRGQRGGRPGADRDRVRRRGVVSRPVRHPAGHGGGVLRVGLRYAGDLRRPLVLADLAADRRSVRHRRRPRGSHLLPVPARPVHRPGDVHRGPHRRGPRRAGYPRGPDALARRRDHRSRPGRGRDCGGAGRHRPPRPARHDRHPGAARRGRRPAAFATRPLAAGPRFRSACTPLTRASCPP